MRTGCPDLDPNWPDASGSPRGPKLCVSYPNCECGRLDAEKVRTASMRTNAMTIHIRETLPGTIRWAMTCEGCGETWEDDADSNPRDRISEISKNRPRDVPVSLPSAGFWLHGHFFTCPGRP